MVTANDSWEPAVQSIKITGGIVTKRATTGRAKLLREVEWLESAGRQYEEHFPRVIAVRVGLDWAEYDMPYYPWPNFSQLILSGSLSPLHASLRLRPVVRFMFDSLYSGIRQPAARQFFLSNYLDKMRRRLETSRGCSARFDSLLNADSLEVNGRRCLSPEVIAKSIEEQHDLLEALQPPATGMFHGDFKPDNILLDPQSDRFVLIDPRGSTVTGEAQSDYIEDIAKLRTSTLALYDIARAGGYAVEVSGSSVRWQLANNFHNSASILRSMDRTLMGWLPALVDASRDECWQLRLSFLTPLLLIANAPFQLVEPLERTEDIAIILYATGAQLLDEAAASWGLCLVTRDGR